MKFNTHYQQFTSSPKETFVGPSETVPDEVLSINEILARYTRGGIRVDTSYPGVASEDDQEFQDEWNSFDPPKAAAQEAPADVAPAASQPNPASEPDSTK